MGSVASKEALDDLDLFLDELAGEALQQLLGFLHGEDFKPVQLLQQICSRLQVIKNTLALLEVSADTCLLKGLYLEHTQIF